MSRPRWFPYVLVMADELDLFGRSARIDSFVLKGIKSTTWVRAGNRRTNSEITSTRDQSQQSLQQQQEKQCQSDESEEDPEEEIDVPMGDDSYDEDNHPLPVPETEDASPVTSRMKRSEWFTKPIHLTQSTNLMSNAVLDELRAPRSSPELPYTLGSKKYSPSSRFQIESPANVRGLSHPDRRVLWGKIDQAISYRTKKTRETPRKPEIRIEGRNLLSEPRTSAGSPSFKTFERQSNMARSSETPFRKKQWSTKGGFVSRSMPNLPTPYSSDLARLRLEGLKLEEQRLLETKRLEELERTRGPWPHWYELRTKQFHQEAKRNNEMLRTTTEWQDIMEYTKILTSSPTTTTH